MCPPCSIFLRAPPGAVQPGEHLPPAAAESGGRELLAGADGVEQLDRVHEREADSAHALLQPQHHALPAGLDARDGGWLPADAGILRREEAVPPKTTSRSVNVCTYFRVLFRVV